MTWGSPESGLTICNIRSINKVIVNDDKDQTLTWQMVCLFFKSNFMELFVALQRCSHHELCTQLANEGCYLQYRNLQVQNSG